MTLGEKIAKQRKELNYTQEQLADILGVSRQSISKWEANIAYPETAKLIEMGKMFDCSMDYLLNEDITEKQSVVPKETETIWGKFKKQFHERKSEKMVCGMPLYHIGRNAHGFFAVGFKAKGVFSIGLMSRGIFSLGLLSLGIISIGLLSLGLIAAGTFSLGLLAVGAIALGLFAAGAISVGIVSFGALSVGCFSSGALAIGKYVAVGDHAHAMCQWIYRIFLLQKCITHISLIGENINDCPAVPFGTAISLGHSLFGKKIGNGLGTIAL